MKKKKVLVSAYFAQNLGDDLFIKVLLDRYPNIDFYLLTANQCYKKIFSDYKNFKIIKSLNVKIGKRSFNFFEKLHNHFIEYKNYDAFVNIGGSIFMENKDWKKGLDIRRKIPEKFKENNKKSFILGANFGPYNDSSFIEEHQKFFSKFEDVCFRDYYSYNIFKSQKNIRIAPDVVFNLKFNHIKTTSKSVGISIINLEQRKELNKYLQLYNQKMTEIIEGLANQGYQIKLFSFCEKEGDLKAIDHLMKNVSNRYKGRIVVVNYSEDINGFLKEFKSCETIIGARFHSIILGLVFNQKVFPIIYSDKTFNLLKDLNIESDCCYIKNIDNLNLEKIMDTTKFPITDLLSRANKQFIKLDLLNSSNR